MFVHKQYRREKHEECNRPAFMLITVNGIDIWPLPFMYEGTFIIICRELCVADCNLLIGSGEEPMTVAAWSKS
jgi:hypothetical protein